MFPLLALTAAKVGSNLLSNAATNAGDNAKAASEANANAAKKAAFAQMMAKVASSPQVKNANFLQGQGIGNRGDAEMTLNQISQKILQSPEVSAITGGRSEAFDLKFLSDGNVSVKTADGVEHVVNLEGNLKETSQKALQIMDSVKVAYPHGPGGMNQGTNAGYLHIVPGGRSTLCL
ncbi:MAG: hypothetical protein NTZ94_05145 [Verrucomicrobia bacterium]|nr:hypothetical protein [Verrucomicrobiota bacterium]